MPRIGGVVAPNMSHHVVQRGHNRNAVFVDDGDYYFLQCCRYIELNPVKAKLVIRPENYRWSSYSENAGLSSSGIVDRHGFTKLGSVTFEGYREFVTQDTPSSEAEFISQRLESNRLTGGARFVKEIESRTGIRLEYKRPGRPPMNKVID